MTGRYSIELSAAVKRAPQHDLPEKIATAAIEFIFGALAENPYRVGKPLDAPLRPQYSARRGDYRVIYLILDHRVVVQVLAVAHRRDAYR